jgi:hypothetical protein
VTNELQFIIIIIIIIIIKIWFPKYRGKVLYLPTYHLNDVLFYIQFVGNSTVASRRESEG